MSVTHPGFCNWPSLSWMQKNPSCSVSVALYEELSSSEEESVTPRVRARTRTRGPSIHDGPQAIARCRVGSKHGARTIYAIYHRLYQYIFYNVIYSCDVQLYFQHHSSSLQCHMIFRNHSNILIFIINVENSCSDSYFGVKHLYI